MAGNLAPLPAPDPDGFPSAFVAGRVVALRIFVSGKTEPKARHRSRVVNPKDGGKPWVQTYPEAKTVNWEDRVAGQAIAQIAGVTVLGTGVDFVLPFAGRVLISLRFNLHKPVSYSSAVVDHLKRPDVDNLAKAVLDGLQKGRIMIEDNLVTDLSVRKRYVSPGHPEGVEIDLTAFG